MNPARRFVLQLILVINGTSAAGPVWADLPDTVARITPSLVAVGTFQRTRSPQFKAMGTGFAVGDGSLIATNVHVIPELLDAKQIETLAIAQPVHGTTIAVREVTKVASDPVHDLVLLKLASGAPLPALSLGDADKVRDGQPIALTGFPVGDVLGLFPITHRGIISAIAPIGIPSAHASQLDAKFIHQLAKGPFDIFQLDATAYPGHSGSPLYDPDSGTVLGIVNMTFIRAERENALSEPSGISYAIPVRYLQDLLKSSAQ